MKPLSQAEQWLPENNHLQMAMNMNKNFNQGAEESAIKVNFMFGLKGIDKGGLDIWDPTKLGELEYDDDFDLTTATN